MREGQAEVKPAATRHRRKKPSKRLGNPTGWDLIARARDAAMEFITLMVACQRMMLAKQPVGARQPMGIDSMMEWRLRYVRTVEQFRANFTPDQLAKMTNAIEASLSETARGIVDGIGASLHARDQYLRACGLTTQFAGSYRVPGHTEGRAGDPESWLRAAEALQRRLDEKGKELGRLALISDLGPCEPRYPSKKKLRAAIAAAMGIDERTVRRLEKLEGVDDFDNWITKSGIERAAEKIEKSRLK